MRRLIIRLNANAAAGLVPCSARKGEIFLFWIFIGLASSVVGSRSVFGSCVGQRGPDLADCQRAEAEMMRKAQEQMAEENRRTLIRFVRGSEELKFSWAELGDYASVCRLSQKDGTFKAYDASGSHAADVSCQGGVLHGPYIRYYPTGQKDWEQYFANGVEEGTRTHWSSTGIKVSEEPIRRGRKTGTERGYYPSGKLKWEATFSEGVLDGPNKLFFAIGQPKVVSNYKQGKLDGLAVVYDVHGKVVSQEQYADGRKIK